jgi:hypothetical protein
MLPLRVSARQAPREHLEQQEAHMQATLERLATVEGKFSAAQALIYESQLKADTDRCGPPPRLPVQRPP